MMETRIETAGEAVEAVWTYDTVGDVTVANVAMHDARGRFVPTADCTVEFTAPEGTRILGWGNGDPAFRHDERPEGGADTISITTFNGLAQVIVQKE